MQLAASLDVLPGLHFQSSFFHMHYLAFPFGCQCELLQISYNRNCIPRRILKAFTVYLILMYLLFNLLIYLFQLSSFVDLSKRNLT